MGSACTFFFGAGVGSGFGSGAGLEEVEEPFAAAAALFRSKAVPSGREILTAFEAAGVKVEEPALSAVRPGVKEGCEPGINVAPGCSTEDLAGVDGA